MKMNIFRLAGDLSHLLAIAILLIKIWKTRSCAGISGKSQILFALVYTTRYLDLFSYFVSLYNSVMKVVFIGASYATLYLLYVKFKATYNRNHDTFRIDFLVIPVVILTLVVNHVFSSLEVLWTFSIYLESVAILPQLIFVSKTWEAETIMLHYLICLGSYRALYILNWVYRYYSQGFYDLIAAFAGVVQTAIYCTFFCLYISRGEKLYVCDIPGCSAAFKQSEHLCSHMYWHTGEKPHGCSIEGEKPLVSDFPNCDDAFKQDIFVVMCPDALAKNPMVALLKSGDNSLAFDNIAMIEKEKNEPVSILTDLSFQAPTSHYSTVAPAIPLPSCYPEVKPGFNDFKQTSVEQIPQYVPEPPKEKGPIPPEHQILQDIFEGLSSKCQQVSTDPQTQRKLDDVAQQLENLYDKLRDNSLSYQVSHGLHQIVLAIMMSDYSAALAVHEQMVQNTTFSEISSFIPSIQVLLQTAAQLNVFLK